MKYPKLIGAALILTSVSAVAGKEDDVLATMAIQRANFTLEQAIEKVSSDYAQYIIEFEIDDHHNQATYEIEAINFDTQEKHKLELSLEDGSVLKEEKKSLKYLMVNRLDDDELLALEELKASNFELGATIAQLKQKYNAELFEFELENEKGITFYKFKLMNEQGPKRVIVDVKTGSALPVMKH